MWERRHGFPVAQRRGSGHRRYDERVVDQVRQVLRRREAGSRLEVAIAGVVLEASSTAAPGASSVFATLRRLHPTLQPQRLRKTSLLALSWAIEDECCALAETPMIFGAFQKERYYRAAEERWTELARVARSTMVFAQFEQQPLLVAGRTSFVDLPDDAPMRREYRGLRRPHHAALLTAWELPGQSSVRDKDRLFEAIWSVEPAAVRSAVACAQVAVQLGHAEAGPCSTSSPRTPRLPRWRPCGRRRCSTGSSRTSTGCAERRTAPPDDHPSRCRKAAPRSTTMRRPATRPGLPTALSGFRQSLREQSVHIFVEVFGYRATGGRQIRTRRYPCRPPRKDLP